MTMKRSKESRGNYLLRMCVRVCARVCANEGMDGSREFLEHRELWPLYNPALMNCENFVYACVYKAGPVRSRQFEGLTRTPLQCGRKCRKGGQRVMF